jgi:uncharacterized membrane protein YfcA
MEIVSLLFILSVIQSLFGVGILLFGTPILLMMGHDYNEVLLYLLPASAALSWSQVKDYSGVRLDGGYRKLFFFICLPMLFLGMCATNYFDIKWYIGLAVTTMLFIAFAIRTSSYLRIGLQSLMKTNLPLALGLMGVIHGLSNMGGSILTPLVSSIYKEKRKVLAGVSFDYAFMASFQLLILLFFKTEMLSFQFLLGAPISLFVRYTIGKRVFALMNELQYQRLIDGLILVNALVLGARLF